MHHSSQTRIGFPDAAAMMAAPCAQPEDEWQDFNQFKTISDRGSRINRAKLTVDEVTGILKDLPEFDNSFPGEISGFKSMAELVNGFDEKLTMCFKNFNTNGDGIYPVPVNLMNEDTVMGSDEIWRALTDNYGSAMPVDWKQSRTRSLHLPSLNLEDNPRRAAMATELSDDEELREQMDTHSIIVSCFNDEPLITVEQVIEEIEEMMQESPDLEAERNRSQSDLSLAQCCTAGLSYEQRVRTLCVAELNELLEEVETRIRSLSEELVQNLALCDELDFEKEVKNSFISVLIDVQNRQKEQRELMRKRRKTKGGAGSMPGRAEGSGSRFSMEGLSTAFQNGFRQTFRSGGSERQYLTTVIPYEKRGGPLSLEDLQTLTKILHAMKDDSDKVPSLLTDYILKVLCPT